MDGELQSAFIAARDQMLKEQMDRTYANLNAAMLGLPCPYPSPVNDQSFDTEYEGDWDDDDDY